MASSTVACQAPLSMGFPRQEYWSELPFSSPGDLPNPGFELVSPALQTDSLPAELLGRPGTYNSLYSIQTIYTCIYTCLYIYVYIHKLLNLYSS